MSEIKVISKETHKVLESVSGNTVSVSEASVVLLKINKDDVAAIGREGNNAVITLKNGEKVIIENFFTHESAQTENSLVFEDDQQKLLWAQFTDANGAVLENIELSYINSIEPLLYHDATMPWAWLALPVAAGGLIAWAVSDNKDKNDSTVTIPNIDTQAPAAPVVNPVNGTDPITGTAEPDSQVIVTFPDGSTETVIAAPDGSWTVANPGLGNGDQIKVTATDAAGNTSPETVATVDAVAPAAPVVDPVNATDPITGTAEPDSTVIVTFPDGSTETVTAAPDGSWTVANPGLGNGDQIKVTATDAAGNTSPETVATVDVDVVAPAAPVVDPVNATDPITGTAEPDSQVIVRFPDGSTETVTAAPDGSWTVANPGLGNGDQIKVTATDAAGNTSPETVATVDAVAPAAPVVDPVNATDPITGTAEPDSQVIVTFPDGSTETVTAAPDGSWTVANPGLDNGDQIKVTATDAAGNTSPETVATVDAVAPAAPVVDPVNATDPITGTAEPDSTVIVTFPDGSTETVTAAPDGSWTVANPGLGNGDQIKVTATDAAGNTSPETVATVDAVAPAAPVVDPVNATDPITGTAEPDSQVIVTFPDGSTETVTAAPDGSWTVANPGLGNGDQIKVTATDAAGNTSPETVATVDAVAPAAPVVDPVNATDPITGTAEPDSTVIVTFPDGSTETVTAAPDGSWTVANPGLGNGDQIKVTATDAAGNTSPETVATVDAVAPAAPVVDPVNATDPITGTAEPDSQVIVTFPDGSTETVTAAPDGSWTVANPGLGNGDQIKVTATDAAGNTSPETVATVDAVAPAAPVVDPVNATDPITGTAEPDSQVIVTFPDGSTETVTAAPDGSWTVANPGLGNGDQIKVTATDAAGNTSPETVATVDAVAPAAPVVDPVNATDPITGTAEPDSTVIVTFPDGSTETVTAAPDGSWTVANPGLGNGDQIKVTATDAAGNTSPETVATVDAVAPAAPVVDPVNATDPITGTAEPDSQVIVTFPDGSTETVTAAPDGSWTVANPGLGNGDQIKVTATDAAGNTSPETVATVDAVAPAAPVVDPVNATDPITGTAEPDSQVIVTFPDGSTETVTAAPDGSWTVVNPGLGNGDQIKVTATDAAGNTSPETVATVDAVAPAAPVVDPVNATDPITGTAEPDSQVIVTFPDGSTETVTAAPDGSWTVANPGLGNGDQIKVTATDAAGNTSPETVATVDAVAPAAPVVDPVNATDPITGTAEPDSTVIVTFPDGSTETVTAAPDGSWTVVNPGLGNGDQIKVTATDAAGNTSPETVATVDAVAPAAPVVDPVNATDPITGTAEPDSQVIVTFPDGSTETVTAAPDGSWTVANPGLGNGDQIKVTATDAAGNTSPETVATVDAVAPAAPVVDPVNATDPITGTAEPDSQVIVTFPDGSTETVTAAPDGSWTVANPGLGNGDQIKVTATDAAGNTSPETVATVDAVAPAAPVVDPVNATDPITGTAEPDSQVIVTFPDGSTETVTAAPDGSWTVANPGLGNGDQIKVTATDAAGNTSPETVATVDAVAPAAPVVDPVNATDPITGTAEPDSQVIVTFPDGSTETVTAAPDGSWTVVNPGLGNGDQIKVTATDAAGNTSPETVATVDAVAPAAPVVDPVNATDPITGTAEPDSQVIVTFPDGSTETVTAAPDGSWTVVNPGLGNGDQIKVTATDAAGNTSPETVATVDAVAPAAPVVDPVNATDPITGTAEPDSTVIVTFPDGSTETVTAAPDGSWTVANPGLGNGDQIKVTATDAAGNTSPETVATVDAVAPAAPVVDPVNATDPITGTAEPDSQVIVTFPDGSTETVTAAPDGSWTVANPGLGNGDQIKVTATDAAGNTSPETVATVDAVAPAAPVVDPVNATDPITGTAEPDSQVIVTFPDGSTETVITAPDGSWTVANPGLGNGDQIKVTATDAAGNTSPETVATVDAVAPAAPVVDPVNATDPITGTAEPDSTVIVTFPDGSTETVTAAPDGSWTVANPGLGNGDQIKVTATDAAGNTSPETVATVDAVAPAAPVVDPVNATDPITGTAEPDSQVIVTFPDGSTETVTAAPDGSWTVANPGLGNGDQIKVTATDAAGNTSPETVATVDAVAPAAPVVDPVNATDPITGTAEPDSQVIVTFPDGSTETVTAAPDGSWTVANPGLGNGDQIKVTATDAAGNTSPETVATVDAVAPAAPVVDPVNATDPITGTAEPDSQVIVTFPDGSTETVTAAPDGSWTVVNPGLGNGDQIKVTATDAAGNTSPETVATVDAVAPAAPVVDPVNATDPITGTAEPDSTVIVTFPDGSTETVTAAPDGSWTVANPGLGNGDQIKVTATDAAGNTSPETVATVDAVAPTLDISASDVELSAGEVITVTFSFSETVKDFDISDILFTGGNLTNLTTTDNKTWTATFTQSGTAQPSISVADGSYTDLAGNLGTGDVLDATNGGFVTDITPLTLMITDDVTNAVTNEPVTFTFSFNKDVADFDLSDIVVTGGTAATTLTKIDDRTYTLLVTPTANTVGTITVNVAADAATDSAGNTNTAVSASQDYDTQAPTQTVTIDSYTDSVGSLTGDFLSGSTTDDPSPILNGKIDNSLATDEQVAIYDSTSNTLIGYAVVSGLDWTYQLNALANLTTYDFYAKVVDGAGNQGNQSNIFSLTQDQLPPTGTITVNTLETADTTPVISGSYTGTLATGEFIQVTVNGITYKQGDGHLTVNTGAKTWSLTIPDTDALNVAAPTDATYEVTAEISNAAGNTVSDNSSNELTVYRDITVNTGPTPEYSGQQPLFIGTAKWGVGEQVLLNIYDSAGNLVTTFNSSLGATAVGGLELDSSNNAWKINANNWNASNQLNAGDYTVQSIIVPADGSTGGQQSDVKPITVLAPKVVDVPNSNDSDINAKVVGLLDGGYVLIWAQNQNGNVNSEGSRYDIVMQRYDQSGEKVGTLTKITNTVNVSEGYADRSDMWNNSGSLSARLNPDNTLTVAYSANGAQDAYIAKYDLNGNVVSTATSVKGGNFYFGFNFVETSNGTVAVYSSGTIFTYHIYAAGSNQATPYNTANQLTTGTIGAGYTWGQNNQPTGARPSAQQSTNPESVSAISLGGSKYLVQYAEFTTAGSGGPTKQTLAVFDYVADGTGKYSSVLQTKIQANSYDNGWQIGAKTLNLKEGGFVSLWLSNHGSATSPTNGGTMDGFDVYSKRFDYDVATDSINALDSNEKIVNTTTNGVNGAAFDGLTTGGFSGTALAHGGYVVVWVKMTDIKTSEVYSQAFDAAGNKIGGETLVSTATVDGSGTVDLLPSVTALEDGGYVVTWSNVTTTNYAANNTSADVKMVIINADGTIRGEGETPATTADYHTGTGVLTATGDAVSTLDGRHGATDLIGGKGNDYFIIKDTNFNSIKGGGGTDTLIWDSTEDLRLADILDRTEDIEVIHLGDANANTLYVTLDDVLSLSPSNDTLVIQGGDTDKVSLDLNQWTTMGTQIYHGLTYNVYTNNTDLSANLWIQDQLSVIA